MEILYLIIKGKLPEMRMEITAVSNNSGKIYIFGGHTATSLLNDMIIFNVMESSWSIIYPSNAPKIAGYSATLLSNGVIVYIGGYNDIQNVDISQISLYDTNSLMWSVQVCMNINQY